MLEKKYNIYFYWWFVFSALFCVAIDLIMSSIPLVSGSDNKIIGIDRAIIHQIIFFSVWVSIINAIWGIINIVSFYDKKNGRLTASKQGFTMVTAYNILIFFVYTASLVLQPSNIVGMGNWSQILKSILEHFFNPFLMVIFYFIAKTEKIKTKDYVIKHSWWTMLIPFLYLTFIVLRGVLIREFTPELMEIEPAFPYQFLDPYTAPVHLSLLRVVGIIGASYGISVAANCLYNKAYKTNVELELNEQEEKKLKTK